MKLELLDGLKGQPITFYEQGNFTDLCRGTHVPSTGKIKFAKLLSIAGAYWRGDEKRPMLTRLYGISFPTKKELDEYLKNREEAEKRDHRKLGKEFELFMITPKVGGGFLSGCRMEPSFAINSKLSFAAHSRRWDIRKS